MRPRSNTEALQGYHSPQVEVDVRLNTNESPVSPPPGWYEAMECAVHDLKPNRYPDREVIALRERLAALHNVGIENIWCANGSNEIIQSLFLAYGGHGRRAVVFEPTYAMHSHIARIAGTEVRLVERNEQFAVSPDTIAEHGPDADVMFLCSPNNPTGTVETRENIEKAVSSVRGVTVVDEAYGQFASWSAIDLINENDSLAVTRTFSKTWAMAGLRLGYVIAPTWLIADLQAVALPYHLSSLAQAAGIAALQFQAEMNERVAFLVTERERLIAELTRLGVQTWPSGANFILFRPSFMDGAKLWELLLEKSVLVRNTSDWQGLVGCLRVTVGAQEENNRFLNALEEISTLDRST